MCGLKPTTTRDHVSVGNLRTVGYMNALALKGIALNEDYILKLDDELDNDENIDQLQEEVSKFLRDNPELDGLLSVNEKFALMAMKMAPLFGKSIPEQLKVIGFTDGVLSKYANPGLTTVSQHGRELGEQAAAMLIDRLEEDEFEIPYQHVVIETELIERGSTG